MTDPTLPSSLASLNLSFSTSSPEKFLDAQEYEMEDNQFTSSFDRDYHTENHLTDEDHGEFHYGVKLLGDNLRKLLETDRYSNDNNSLSNYSFSGTASVNSNTSATPRSTTQAPDALSPTLKRLMQRQKQKYELILKAQGEEHAKQIEEIIEQLSDIDVKYQADISVMQQSLAEKQNMITSLHTTLDEIRSNNNRLVDENSQFVLKLSALRQDYESCVLNCKDLERALQNAKLDLTNIRLQQERLISEAVMAAQDEIKAEADRQFAHANKMFLQLKKDYSIAVEERDMWMKRYEETMANVQNSTQAFQSRMEALNYQLESTKTELELSKLEQGKVRQQLQSDSIVFAERMEEMRRDVVRMDKECAEAHQLVGTAVREKERLRKEVQELKAVCEELVTMVESGEER